MTWTCHSAKKALLSDHDQCMPNMHVLSNVGSSIPMTSNKMFSYTSNTGVKLKCHNHCFKFEVEMRLSLSHNSSVISQLQ